jgi:hypothetical protein
VVLGWVVIVLDLNKTGKRSGWVIELSMKERR